MLLVLNVVYNNIISAQAVRDLHRSRTWACEWLKRYSEKGLEELRNRTKKAVGIVLIFNGFFFMSN
jgi:hypothetical protein